MTVLAPAVGQHPTHPTHLYLNLDGWTNVPAWVTNDGECHTIFPNKSQRPYGEDQDIQEILYPDFAEYDQDRPVTKAWVEFTGSDADE